MAKTSERATDYGYCTSQAKRRSHQAPSPASRRNVLFDLWLAATTSAIRIEVSAIGACGSTSRQHKFLWRRITSGTITGKAITEKEWISDNGCINSKPSGRGVAARMRHRLP